MVEITSRAEELLLQLRGQQGDETDGVRFETAAGKIRLAFASEAKPSDRVLEGARLPIYIAAELADSFHEAKIDAEQTNDKQKIVVTRSRPAL